MDTGTRGEAKSIIKLLLALLGPKFGIFWGAV